MANEECYISFCRSSGKLFETTKKDDDQLLIEVRQAIIDNLPESQRPKPDTPSSAKK
jgi:hypothetical protein